MISVVVLQALHYVLLRVSESAYLLDYLIINDELLVEVPSILFMLHSLFKLVLS